MASKDRFGKTVSSLLRNAYSSPAGRLFARPLLALRIRHSAARILRAIGPCEDLTFVRSYGNAGDLFIEAGIRRLLAPYRVNEVSARKKKFGDLRGDVAVIAGGGAWCQPYHDFMPALLRDMEKRFRRVVVLPSSFDPAVPEVAAALRRSAAMIFAREERSYRMIAGLAKHRGLAFDCAFYAELPRRAPKSEAVLNAFRTERESRLLTEGFALPPDNRDVSDEVRDLAAWLDILARYRLVRTDRAHVMIASALLGAKVEYFPSSYHKLDGIAAYSLRGLPVTRLDPEALLARGHAVRSSEQ